MPFEIDNEKKKRHRRTATEIARHYKCPIDDCPKSYGSEGSLNQHIKLKHPEYYQEVIQQNNANQSMAELGQITGVNPSLLQGGLIRHNNLRQIDENDDSQSESENSDEESND